MRRLALLVTGLSEGATTSVDDEPGHDVRVHVGVGPPILDVALAPPPPPARGCAPRHPGPTPLAELAVVGGLVVPCEPILDAVAVAGDVLLGVLPKRFRARRARRRSPPAWPWSRSSCGQPAPFQSPRTGFGSSVTEIPKSSPRRCSSQRATQQLIGNLDRPQWADLELPLTGHDLGVDARDRQAGGQAGVQVGLDQGPAVDVVGAHPAVVRALGRRVAGVLREAERPAALEQGVLLLDPEQRLLPGVLLDRPRPARRGCWSGAG